VETYVVETPAGVFAIDKDGSAIEKTLFGKKADEAAEKLRQLQSGIAILELKEFIQSVEKAGFDTLVTETDPLAKALRATTTMSVRVEVGSATVTQFREKLATDWKGRSKWLKQQKLDVKPIEDFEEYQRFIRQVTVELARSAVTTATAKRDLYAVQAVRAIDDIDKTINLFVGRIREWYGLHFPELDRLVEKNDTYARLVADLGLRSNFTEENLGKEGIPSERISQIASSARKSMGANFPEEDLEWLRSFCNDTLELARFREKAETYVDEVMKQAAPNTTTMLGPLLTARLMSIAGGLMNLAKMPASTMQVLGAEKALFRSLKTGARPPKHGVIFQYASIHNSPRWQRGKIARAVSGKLAIAARVDAFGGDYMGDKLTKDLEKKVSEIQTKYKDPPIRTGEKEPFFRRRDEGRRGDEGRRRDRRRRR
jgi:nucleolar protein 56